METTKMITTIKLTGETVAVAMGVAAVAMGVAAVATGATAVASHRLGGVVLGLGTVGAGTGLSRHWTPVVMDRVVREERSERPTQAPKAAAMAAKYGYVHAIGAGNQQERQFHLAQVDFAADATRSMRAFRGLDPWRERT